MYRIKWSKCTLPSLHVTGTARMGHVAVTVDDSTAGGGGHIIVVHGGLGENKRSLNDLLVFHSGGEGAFCPDVGEGSSPARAFHCAAAIDRDIYVFGGHVFVPKKGLQKFNDLWCLNTVFCCFFLSCKFYSTVLFYVGTFQVGYRHCWYVLSPSPGLICFLGIQDTWGWHLVSTQVDGPKPAARDFAKLVPLSGHKLLMVGGLDSAERRLDDAWVFDATTLAWSEVKVVGPKPRARYGHALLGLEQRVLLLGGETFNGVTNELWTLRGVVADSEDDPPAWLPLELTGPAPAPRKGHAAADLGSVVVVMGGHSSESSWFRAKTEVLLSDVLLLDRSTIVAWQQPDVEGEPPAPREYHTLTPVSVPHPTLARLLLFGGGNGKTIFNDAWWLDVECHAALAATPPASNNPSLAAAMSGVLSAASALRSLSVSSSHLAFPPSQATADERHQYTAKQAHGNTAAPIAIGSFLHPSPAMKQLLVSMGVKGGGHAKRASSLPVMPVDTRQSLRQLGYRLKTGEDRRWHCGFDATAPAGVTEENVARSFLSSSSLADMKVDELRLMLQDYKALSSYGVTMYLQEFELRHILRSDALLFGRFSHVAGEQLRLSDAAQLQEEYKVLIQQHSVVPPA